MNQQLKLQHQFLCGDTDNFDIFTLSAPDREILIVVKTQTLPVHFFGAFHLREENCASNESAAQIVSSISFDLQLVSIFFFFFIVVAHIILTFSPWLVLSWEIYINK